MSRIVAQQSDYLNLLRDSKENREKVKFWEDQFNIAQQEISNKISYDISGAFANYQKQQRNLANIAYLGSGFKEEIANELYGDYESAYGQLKNKETELLGDLTSNYTKQLMSNEKLLGEEASKLADLNRNIYEFAGITDTENLFKPTEAGGLDFYRTDNGIDFELTDRGVDFYNQIFNTKYKGESFFSDYLYETSPELYDYYSSNLDKVKNVLAGLEPGHNTYTEDDKYRVSSADLQKEYESLVGSTDNKQFSSYKEKADYYNKASDEKLSSDRITKAKEIKNDYSYAKLASSKGSKSSLNKYDDNLSKDLKNVLNLDDLSVKTMEHYGHATGWERRYSTEIKINTKNLSDRQIKHLKALGGWKKGNTMQFTLSNTPHSMRNRLEYGEMSFDEFMNKLKG